MSQLIALTDTSPKGKNAINYEDMVTGAENIAQSRLKTQLDTENLGQERQKTQLNAMGLDEATREHNAVNSFRDAAAAGDKNAMGKLSAYPEEQAKFQKAYDSMEEGAEKRKARKTAKAVGAGALAIAQFPEGTPERIQKGIEIGTRLVQQGHISQEQFDAAKSAGFPDIMLGDYVELGKWAQSSLPDSKLELAQARLREIEARIDTRDAESAAKIAKLEADAAKIEASTKSDEQQAAELDKLHKQIANLDSQIKTRQASSEQLGAQREASANASNARAEASKANSASLTKSREASANAADARAKKSLADIKTEEERQAKIEVDRASAAKSRATSKEWMSDKEIEDSVGKYRSDITPQYFGEDDLAGIDVKVQAERKRLKDEQAAKKQAATEEQAASEANAPQKSGDGTSAEKAVVFTPGKWNEEFAKLPPGAWFINPKTKKALRKKLKK